jgi:hypothetical protein
MCTIKARRYAKSEHEREDSCIVKWQIAMESIELLLLVKTEMRSVHMRNLSGIIMVGAIFLSLLLPSI